VHVDGMAVRSCRVGAATVGDRRVTTIEGLATSGPAAQSARERLHPCQQAWIDEDVPQCGYCQAGQIMTAAALLARNPRPDDAAIEAALNGNLGRCGTYVGIRRAIRRAAEITGGR
jgi:aerobic-type carbon monoxide dehydrogenase small subunit (CoxS/CutS family)